MKHLLWLLFLVAGLSACKEKVKSESDKQYDQYVAYQKIYSAYGKVPSDTTKLT
jgi:hypothetical protein